MFICHDLKREIDPVAPPLPSSLRIVPILFYVAVAGCAFFSAYFLIQQNAAEKARLAQEEITQQELQKIALVDGHQRDLEQDVNRAKSMIEWIRGSDLMQPLAMVINRSIGSVTSSEGGVREGTLNKLSLTRRPENPWQIQLDLKLNGLDTGQLDETLQDLEAQDYKKFSPRRSQDEEGINYSATLIKQTPADPS